MRAVSRKTPIYFIIIMVKCNDDNIRWDVKDSAVQHNHHLNSMTGNHIETSAKGEISRLEVYERHKAKMDAADN